MVTLTAVSGPDKKESTVFKNEFPRYHSDYFFLYYTSNWKPPNAA
ncbi:hypothetical protein [Paraflavitalea sp. CAU 1676]|nr:hypothetical protein [Paraflavitalea sp. CAU 1676]MDF2191204.1 hypothetical protein [Paraflavitalea sp. CAU 1676]